MRILRAMTQTEWDTVCQQQYYGQAELKRCGFIHCATAETILEVLERHFRNIEEPVVLLYIETDRVIHQIKWEDRHFRGVDYPHVCGALNLSAVDRVVPVPTGRSGDFMLPPDLM